MLAFDYNFTGDVLKGERPSIYDSWWDHYGDYVIIASVIVAIGLAAFIWHLLTKTKLDHSIPREVTFYGYDVKYYQYGSYLNPDVPEKEGYAFCGWFRDPAFLEPWKSTDKVKRDITLYPKWEKER